MTSPSGSIISGANRTSIATDKNGRRIAIRPLTALDTLRLFKAAGPTLAQNEAWLSMAGLAYSVTSINDIPVPSPTTEAQIESLIEKLGDDGLVAVTTALNLSQPPQESSVLLGNSLGTPS